MGQAESTTKKRGKKLPLQEFFEFLKTLKNETDWIQAPGGHALIKFLAEKTEVSAAAISNKINLLEKLGFVQKGYRGDQKGVLWRIKLLVQEWDESKLSDHYAEQEQKISQRREGVLKTETGLQGERSASYDGVAQLAPELYSQNDHQSRRFLVLIDYRNLEQNISNPVARLKDFSWLLNPILEKGRIFLVFVFIPDHYTTRAGIMQLTQKHRFNVVICPRQIKGIKTKDADTVDTKIYELAYPLIDHSDATDVVIVSGDADFIPLVAFARNQQKKVHIISAAQALSGRFRDLEESGAARVEVIP